MKLDIRDASCWPESWLIIFVGVTYVLGYYSKSEGNGRTRSEDKAEAKSSPAKEPATGSVDSERAQNSITSGPSGWQRIVTLSALLGILFSVYALFCMTVLLPFYGQDFYEELGPSFTRATDVPVYTGAVLFFIWIAAAVLQWRQITQIEGVILRSPLGHAAVWLACAVLGLNELSLAGIVLYPFLENTRDIDQRVFSHLHLAYEQSSPGRILFSALFGLVILGYTVVYGAWILAKVSSAMCAAGLTFAKLQHPCYQYLFHPLGQCVLQPLYRLAAGPLSSIKAALYRYIIAYGSKNLELIVWNIILLCAPAVVTSAIILTASEDDEYLWQQRSRPDVWLQLGIFYSLVFWMLWQTAAAVNFAPAVRLERLVYSSRTSWVLQTLVCFPWLYNLWRMVRFFWLVTWSKEGIVLNRLYDDVKELGSFTIFGSEYKPLAAIWDFCFTVCTVGGFQYVLICLVTGIWVSFKEAISVGQPFRPGPFKSATTQ